MLQRLARRLSGLVCAAALVGCSSARTASPPCPPSRYRHAPPLVIAHGGGEGLAPGNTILAMQRSLAAGADVLDLDLRMTSDGVIVARHDRDLATSTDGSGMVDEHSWAEIQKLDTRSFWTGAPIAEPVGVPSLAQVLAEFGDVRMSLEFKQSTPSMAKPLCDLLRSASALNRVYLGGNDDAIVNQAKADCPELAIVNTIYEDLAEMRSAHDSGPQWCSPAPFEQPPYREGHFSAKDVQWAHDHGVAVYTWTVDDEKTLWALAEAGVDGVYTRRPDIARKIFDEISG